MSDVVVACGRGRRRRLLGVLVASCMVSLLVPAMARAQTGQVHGVVRSLETGEPLAGVRVAVVDTRIDTMTDEGGGYRVDIGSEGGATLRFTLLGYLSRTVRVEFSGVQARELDLELSLDPIPLQALTVIQRRHRLVGETSDALRIPGSARVVKIEESPAPGLFGDIQRVLREVPGVNIREEEGYGLRPNIGLRGSAPDRSAKITVMEDGVLIAPAPYAAPAAYYFPTTGRMEAVEVRKGSSQIEYGPHTLGGALNLISSSIPGEFTARAELQVGDRETRKARVLVGDTHRNFGWLAETYQLSTAGFKGLDSGGDTGFGLSDYLVKLRVNTDPAARHYQLLEFKVGRTEQDSDETYLGLTDSDFRATPFRRYAASQRDHLTADHRLYQARHYIRPFDALDLTTTLYRNEFERNWYKLTRVGGKDIGAVVGRPSDHESEMAILRGGDSAPDALIVRANQREYLSTGVQSVLGFRLEGGSEVHEVDLGLRYHRDEEDRFEHQDGYQMLHSVMVRNSSGTPGSQSNRVVDARAWAFFLQDRISFGRWVLSPGLRREAIRYRDTRYATDDPGRAGPGGLVETGVDVWIPGIGISSEVGSGAVLFGGVHKGFGPPGAGADQEAKSEISVSYELGARLGWRGASINAVGFFNDYKQILGRATLSQGGDGSGDLFNGGKAAIGGLELSVDYDPAVALWPGITLPVHLSYTYTHAEFRTEFESTYAPWGLVAAGDRIPFIPAQQLHGRAGVDGGRWDVTLAASYLDPMRTSAGRGAFAPGEGTDRALVLDLSGSLSLGRRGEIQLSLQNLTDRRYIVARQPAGARPGLPRTFAAGIRIAS